MPVTSSQVHDQLSCVVLALTVESMSRFWWLDSSPPHDPFLCPDPGDKVPIYREPDLFRRLFICGISAPSVTLKEVAEDSDRGSCSLYPPRLPALLPSSPVDSTSENGPVFTPNTHLRRANASRSPRARAAGFGAEVC